MSKKLIMLVASLGTALGACYVESHPAGYYNTGYYHPYRSTYYRCPYGWFFDGYRCRHY